MPRAREVLERLRPVGAPGAAGPAGVPVDRRAEVAAELEPVFAALADTGSEVQRLLEAGAAEARRRRELASRRAAQILATARRDAQAERAQVAAGLRHQADVAAAEARAAAETEAERIRRGARRRLPSLVARVVERVRADLELAASPRGPGGAR